METYLRAKSPSVIKVAMLDIPPPGQVNPIINATAVFGPSENARAPQKATRGSKMYWQAIPRSIDQGLLKWFAISFKLMWHPRDRERRSRPSIPKALMAVSRTLLSSGSQGAIVALVDVSLHCGTLVIIVQLVVWQLPHWLKRPYSS